MIRERTTSFSMNEEEEFTLGPDSEAKCVITIVKKELASFGATLTVNGEIIEPTRDKTTEKAATTCHLL